MTRFDGPCPLSDGTRVRVTGVMPNDPDPMPVGAEGVVTGGNGGQIWVAWDDSRRSLILLPTDPYQVVTQTQGGDTETA